MAERLKQQIAHQYPQETSDQQGVFIQRRRASAPATQTRRPAPPIEYDDEADDDAIYTQRPPSSARRYLQQPEVYTEGNRRIVVHRGEPPRRKSRFVWMIFMGLAMFIMVIGWILFTALGYWWQGKQDDWKYGSPFRTYQIDQFVGHGDTPDHPDHFIAVNAGGVIEVVELNPLQPKYDHVYPITTVNDSTIPAVIGFEDTNHDGKLDMLVTIGDSNSYTIILLNNGSQFTK